ncbi:MAG: O-antigen translocase [Beijerinckiaceae bacterium]|nr:O-antigen translocase [Beijerinckiaceae bacterium]MCI0734727.1 O-antigen translocase [Beijerinckiaceae bacterium]
MPVKHQRISSALSDVEVLVPPPEVAPAVEVPAADNHSYGQILKSSALIGGSSVLNIGIGIVRTKAMAVMLGPAGFGLMGLYGSIADLAVSIAGMGVNNSGVRQIAEAAASGDDKRIAQTATVLRRTAVFLGILGAGLLAVFPQKISELTFGTDKHAGAVALLSLAVFFRLVAGGQGTLVQGMRRIADLAKMGVLGALFGTMISIPMVYFLREEGVVPSLLCVAAASIVTSWWYSRKVRIQPAAMTVSEVRHEVTSLLKLGFAFMAAEFLVMGAAYAVRIIVVQDAGLEAAGLYSSAWTLGGLYVGYVLQAMGADFYPRLVGVANDNIRCNRLVNEQAQVSLLLAGPGIIATLTFAPLVIALFYSAKFAGAVEILRWICLGMALRVITWPMGFIIVAKNRQLIFLGADLAWTVVNVGLAWLCVGRFGVTGAGIAFFGSYVFHGFMIYPIVRILSGFRWSADNLKTGAVFVSSIAVVFCSFHALPPLAAAGIGTLAIFLSGFYSIGVLVTVMSPDRIPRSVRRLLVWLRYMPRMS